MVLTLFVCAVAADTVKCTLEYNGPLFGDNVLCSCSAGDMAEYWLPSQAPIQWPATDILTKRLKRVTEHLIKAQQQQKEEAGMKHVREKLSMPPVPTCTFFFTGLVFKCLSMVRLGRPDMSLDWLMMRGGDVMVMAVLQILVSVFPESYVLNEAAMDCGTAPAQWVPPATHLLLNFLFCTNSVLFHLCVNSPNAALPPKKTLKNLNQEQQGFCHPSESPVEVSKKDHIPVKKPSATDTLGFAKDGIP